MIGADLAQLFNYLTGFGRNVQYRRLLVAPHPLRTRLYELIDQEVAAPGGGRIVMKMNSLVDPGMIDRLYAASRAGVQIDLIVRGICCLRPGVPNLSENIRVKSIVGRFLEHARIVAFANGAAMPSAENRVFISSADWMGRNLERRVEALIECHNPTVKEQIVGQIMAANLRDRAQSWVLSPDGSFTRDLGAPGEDLFSCHRFFMEVPSLSGRGSAGADDVPRLARPAE